MLEPSDTAWTLEPGTDLVLLLHMIAGATSETVQPTIGLFFSDTPPRGERGLPLRLRVLPVLGNAHLLDIPAGKKEHRVALTHTLPGEATVCKIRAHAHFLLKDASVVATLPDGKALPLLKIKNWDFNWQDSYHFADPPRLPKGTRIDVLGLFDNSADNPQNPSSQPREVHFGLGSLDEMFGAEIFLAPTSPASTRAYQPTLQPLLDLRLPPGGFPLPRDGMKNIRENFDKDGDGKLTREEIEAMPADLRSAVIETIRARIEEDAKRASLLEGLVLPPEGVPIPANARMIRERFDLNGDGKLTRAEVEAIPLRYLERVAEILRRAQGKNPRGTKPDPPAARDAKPPPPRPSR